MQTIYRAVVGAVQSSVQKGLRVVRGRRKRGGRDKLKRGGRRRGVRLPESGRD